MAATQAPPQSPPCPLAPGDTASLGRLPSVLWTVVRRWQSVGADYVTVEWVELYAPDRGRVMVRWGDAAEKFYTPPRPAPER